MILILCSAVCGGEYSHPRGFLVSPGFPYRYRKGRECTFNITQPIGALVNITVISFEVYTWPTIDDCQNCSCDYLEIREGNHGRWRIHNNNQNGVVFNHVYRVTQKNSENLLLTKFQHSWKLVGLMPSQDVGTSQIWVKRRFSESSVSPCKYVAELMIVNAITTAANPNPGMVTPKTLLSSANSAATSRRFPNRFIRPETLCGCGMENKRN